VQTLVKRLKEEGGMNDDDERDKLALRLNEQYPDDVGVMCAYLLNYIKLQPGEAVYMAANEPHAYLDGECVEVMATSDNVVRAGLTPKARDTEILCDMLTYKLGKPEILTGDVIDKNTKRYSPPFDEFELEVISCSKNETAELTVSQGPSILLVKNGKGALNDDVAIEKGSVVFVNANEKIALKASSDDDVSIYRAQVNTRVF
jgi:mannose-6-phosphate isomerase